MTSNTTYVASDDNAYRYPGAGDEPGPVGAKVLVLTAGGVCLATGWLNIPHFVAWAPLPKRDHAKENSLAQTRQTDFVRPP